jgi:hypothetical protein
MPNDLAVFSALALMSVLLAFNFWFFSVIIKIFKK